MKYILRNRKYMRGVSTLSVAITLAVSIVMLMGALAGYKYIDQTRVNNDVMLMARLKQNTMRYGQAVGTFSSSNASLSNLYALGFFDDQTLSSSGAGASVTHQWGGSVTVSVATTASEANDGLNFTFTNIPNNICIDLGSRLDAFATEVRVSSAAVKTALDAVKTINSNTNITTLTSKCTATGAVKSMDFIFSK